MENNTENNVWKNNLSSEQAAPTLGKMLREARERLGLSVADVAGQIKFAPRQIEALEADDYPRLPETAFLRGFVRSYGKILHLDANTLLAALPQKKSAPVELTPELVGDPFPNVQSVLQQNYIWLGAALLLAIIAVVFALWHLTSPPEAPKPALVESPISLPAEILVAPPKAVPEVAVVPPVVQKKKPSAAVAQSSVPAAKTVASQLAQQKPKQATTFDTRTGTQAGTQTDTRTGSLPDSQAVAKPDTSPITMLRMVFNEESWAEIKDKNGKILSSRLHAPGSEMRVNGRAPFSLQIAKASTVGLFYQGKQIDLKPYISSQNDIARFILE